MSDAYKFISWKSLTPLPGCHLSSGWTLVEYILFCHIIWWVFYWFLLLVTRQSEEWCCRLLTLFHGCTVSILVMHDIYINKCEMDFHNTPLSESQKNYLSFMLSYFLFDFFWIHLFGNEAWIIYLHHISSIFILLKIMVSDSGGVAVSYGVAGLEFTNPYLQLRWFLRTQGYLNTFIHSAIEIWFFVSFFIIRIIGGTILFYYTEVHPDVDIIMKLSCLSIYAISLVLAWQIFQYCRKKYWTHRERRTVSFITSRVSISPYFQRRTLDNTNEHRSSPQNEQTSRSPEKAQLLTFSSSEKVESAEAAESSGESEHEPANREE